MVIFIQINVQIVFVPISICFYMMYQILNTRTAFINSASRMKMIHCIHIQFST